MANLMGAGGKGCWSKLSASEGPGPVFTDHNNRIGPYRTGRSGMGKAGTAVHRGAGFYECLHPGRGLGRSCRA